MKCYLYYNKTFFNFLHQRRAGADQELRYSAIKVKLRLQAKMPCS